MLNRRAVLVVLATGCLAPIPVAAQQDKPVRLGVLSMTSGVDSVPRPRIGSPSSRRGGSCRPREGS